MIAPTFGWWMRLGELIKSLNSLKEMNESESEEVGEKI